MLPYLECTPIINFDDSALFSLAKDLSSALTSDAEIAQKCFEYVRDQIRHTGDHQEGVTTCSASDVERMKTGWCYAKAHLLAALLRANGIPAGFCYQRLSISGKGAPYALHGLNAIFLKDHGWYRVDPRGNKEGINAQFHPPAEQLAFEVNEAIGELDMREIFPQPLPDVVDALSRFKSYDEIRENFPDIEVVKR